MDISLARIVQLIARLIAAVLVAKAGMDAEHAGAIGTAGGELAGAVLMGLLDLAIHSGRFGWLASVWAAGAESGQGSVVSGQSEGTNGSNGTLTGTFTPGIPLSKMGLALLFVGLGLFGASCFVGCAQNETNRVAQAMVTTKTHAEQLDYLVTAKIVTDAATIDSLQKAVHAEKDAEDAYYDAIKRGDSAGLAAAKAALLTATADALPMFSKYPLPPPPATLPNLTPATTAASTK